MHNVALATLLELCDNSKTLAHVEAWRGNKELTAPALLLQLWRKEEAEIGVKRDQHGQIAGIVQYTFFRCIFVSHVKKEMLCIYSRDVTEDKGIIQIYSIQFHLFLWYF